MRRVRRLLAAGFLLAAAPQQDQAGIADHFYLALDVPTDLGGATYLPWQIVRADEERYSPVLQLPDGIAIDALHRMDNGNWLISVESPAILGGLPAAPADILEFYDYPGGYASRFDGIGSGVPAGVNVISLFLDGGDAGDLVMSFDVPVTLGGQTFQTNDLVRFDGSSFTLYFDGSATTPSIPDSMKVAGVDKWEDILLLSFDIPANLGALTVMPGEIVSWDGARFALLHSDAAWPAGSRAAAFALLARPGLVPPTIEVRSSQLRGRITISWSAGCSAGAENYAIYEGTIGTWYSHAAIDCSDDGADLQEDVAFSHGDQYYLVVPLNAGGEGSHGLAPDGAERPRGATTCVASQRLGACP